MRFGVVIPSYGRFADPVVVLQLVGLAEELGYDGAWFSDHVAIPPYAAAWIPPPHLEALTTCAVAMGRTTRLRFGVDVLIAAYRNPLVLAAMASTAAGLSGGRLTLGIGVGYLEGEFTALGLPYDRRGALTDESLRAIRQVWDGSSGLHVGIPVSSGGIPLWVGGNVNRALTRAARLGDGWHPLWPSPEGYAEARRRIVEMRAHAGIERPFTFSLSCPRTMLLSAPGAAAGAVPDAVPGASEGGAGQTTKPSRKEFGYVPPLPRDGRGRARFTGTADELAGDIEAYATAGVEHLVVRFWTSADAAGPDQVASRMTEFAEQITARFR